MGSTQFKRFMECEAQAVAIINGLYRPETSTALLVGSYVDAFIGNELADFTAKHPEIFKRDGTLKADFIQAEQIIERIGRDDAFVEAVSGESQIIMTGEIEGVPVKIKIDSLLPDRTVDLKIMADMADKYVAGEGYVPFWQAWRYDIQAAMYQEIRRQNDGKRVPFGLAVATKEKPEPDLALLEFKQETLDVALQEIQASIVYFDGLKQGLYEPDGCGKCAWCRKNKQLKGWELI